MTVATESFLKNNPIVSYTGFLGNHFFPRMAWNLGVSHNFMLTVKIVLLSWETE